MKTFCELGLNPGIENLKNELDARREEYAKLLAEYDDLTGAVRDYLETEYMMRIGRLEYRLFSLQIEVRQLKREIALYQAAKNRRETVSAAEVDAIIAREFAEYKSALAEQQQKIRQAEERHFCPKLSVADSKALRTLYHDMVRKLHPDLNRELPEEAKRLWVRIAKAYRNSDWQELNILADMVYDLLDGRKPAVDTPNRMEQLLEEQRRIAAKTSDLRKRMGEMRGHPPYSYMELLKDDKAINARRRELQELLHGFERHIAELTDIRDGLRGGQDA